MAVERLRSTAILVDGV